jgi:ketosteroid isomerase-like protein
MMSRGVRRLASVALVLLGSACLASSGCDGGADIPDEASERTSAASPESNLPRDLALAIESFYHCIETDDHEGRIALFDENAIMMPNNGHRILGKEAIAAVVRAGEGWVFRLRERRILDAGFDGGLAYTVNAYDYTYHPEGDEPVWHPTKNVHLWRLGPEGGWKLYLDIWNSDGR